MTDCRFCDNVDRCWCGRAARRRRLYMLCEAIAAHERGRARRVGVHAAERYAVSEWRQPSADEWRGVAGHARDAATMLDILADEFAATGYRESSLRREASNMRGLADGIDRDAAARDVDPLAALLARIAELRARELEAAASSERSADPIREAVHRHAARVLDEVARATNSEGRDA